VLQPGDVLVLDNAQVHKANGIRDMLLALLVARNVRLIYMPTYSPELSPCELVFAQSKRYLRDRRGLASFQTEMLRSYAGVTLRDVCAYYFQCIQHFDR